MGKATNSQSTSLARAGRPGFISLWILLIIVVVVVVSLAIISRNWSCRGSRWDRKHRQDTPVRWGPYAVVEVTSGASLTVDVGRRAGEDEPGDDDEPKSEWTLWLEEHLRTCDTCRNGFFGSREPGMCDVAFKRFMDEERKHRESEKSEGRRDRRKERSFRPVTLTGISVPDTVAVESKASLVALAGSHVSIDCPKQHAIRKPDEFAGVVYGESGAVLQVEQLRAGMAKCGDKPPKDWTAAEAEAKAAKRGVWKNEPDPKPAPVPDRHRRILMLIVVGCIGGVVLAAAVWLGIRLWQQRSIVP